MAWTISYQGGRFDQRTYDMLREVERLLPFQIFVSQGGYNTGGVAASAGTHDRAAVDISASLLTTSERAQLDRTGRRVGFAGWIRTPAQGFPWHWHGVPVGGDLAPAARAQVVQYYAGENGLAGHGADDGTRDYVGVTWETYKSGSAYRPPINTDPGTGSGTLTDWLDMASEADVRKWISEEVTKALRNEGVSGAAVMDPGQYPNGTYTVGAKVAKISSEETTKALRVEGISSGIEAIRKKLGA